MTPSKGPRDFASADASSSPEPSHFPTPTFQTKEILTSITINTGPNATPAAGASFATRLLTLCYGGVAYLIFLGDFSLRDRLLSRDLSCPRRVDKAAGMPSSLMTALLINLVVMSFFAWQHSGMARRGFKRCLRASPLRRSNARPMCRWPALSADPAVLAVAADADDGLEYPEFHRRRHRDRGRLPRLAHRALQHLPDQPFRVVRTQPRWSRISPGASPSP